MTAGEMLKDILTKKKNGENTAKLEQQFEKQSIEQLGGSEFCKKFNITTK